MNTRVANPNNSEAACEAVAGPFPLGAPATPLENARGLPRVRPQHCWVQGCFPELHVLLATACGRKD